MEPTRLVTQEEFIRLMVESKTMTETEARFRAKASLALGSLIRFGKERLKIKE